MMALTVWQPWASLIMAGWKRHEWRTHDRARSFAGQRIVIHAGRRAMKWDELRDLRARLLTGATDLQVEPSLELVRELLQERTTVPLGAGLGTVLLGEPRRATEIMVGVADSDRIDQHMWGWPVSDPQPFEPVVPCRGFQGFWRWPEKVAA